MKPISKAGYDTDLTDEQWKLIEPLIPKFKTGGRRPKYSRRALCNGIFYITRAGCAWRLLPRDLPEWRSVYRYFRLWGKLGVWRRVNDRLREDLRRRQGRKPRASAGVIDSQSVKSSDHGGEKRGYDGGKKNQRSQTPYPGGYSRLDC